MTYQRRSDVAAGEVRALLGRNRQSINDLSVATGISLSTLNRRLSGERPFTLDDLDKIAIHFDVDPKSLITPPEKAVAS